MRSPSVSSRPRPRTWVALALSIAGSLTGAGLAPSAQAQPPATDLGALNTSAATNIGGISIGPPPVAWFKFTISAVSPAMFLDIDTEGTSLTPSNDSMIGLYDALGNFIASNDDGGSGALSELSFGAASPSRPGFADGVTFQGQDGPLAPGTYYLAFATFPTTFGPTAWDVTSPGLKNGTGALHLRLGPPGAMPVADAGPDQTAPEGSTVALDASASSGGLGCPTVLTWTQIAGPSVALDLTDPVHPTFVAPQVAVGGATVTFRLDVATCPSGSTSTVVNVTVTNVNSPPSAQAGIDQTVAEGSPVVLDGSASFDPDNDPIALSWVQSSGPAVSLNVSDPLHPTFTAPFVGPAGAVLVFTLGVSDGLETNTDSVSVTVQNVNHPPVASAGPDSTHNEGTVVTLNGSGSNDPDGDPLTYSWSQISGPSVTLAGASGPSPTFTAPQVNSSGATLVFRLTVSDGLASNTDDVSIAVHDAVTPPNCASARPCDDVLWPPNHCLVPIAILGVTDPCHGNASIEITGVTQDEPIRGTGSGDTGPDAVVIGSVVLLRAERAGNGNGRVYHIHFRATNAGGSCTGMVKVSVPHDQGHNGAAIDGGELYNSVGP